MRLLKQGVDATVNLGPFRAADGYTQYTAGGFTVYLSVNAGSFAPRAGATLTHDMAGMYKVALTGAADLATAGRIELFVPDVPGSYMDVWKDWFVLPPAVYDSLVSDNNGLAKLNQLPAGYALETDLTTALAGLATLLTRVGANVALNSDMQTSLANWTTLLTTRLTTTRTTALDYIVNAGGTLASQALVNSLDTATPLARLTVTPTLVKPATGTIVYPIFLQVANLGGALTDVDGGTINLLAVTNGAGTDRSANLTGWVHASTGLYENGYTVHATDGDEGLIFRFGGTVGGGTPWSVVATPAVADAQSYSTSDRTMIQTLVNALPAHIPLVDSAGLVAANNIPTDYQQRGVAVTLPTTPPAGYAAADAATAALDTVLDGGFTVRQALVMHAAEAAGVSHKSAYSLDATKFMVGFDNPFNPGQRVFNARVNPATQERETFEPVNLG